MVESVSYTPLQKTFTQVGSDLNPQNYSGENIRSCAFFPNNNNPFWVSLHDGTTHKYTLNEIQNVWGELSGLTVNDIRFQCSLSVNNKINHGHFGLVTFEWENS